MIVYDMSFLSLNEYINIERANKYKAAMLKKQQTNNCYYFSKLSKIKPFENRVDIKFIWHTPDNKKDHDNISFAKKFILDGLVKSGILKNDNPRYVGNFIDEFKIDKNRNYTYCIIHFK